MTATPSEAELADIPFEMRGDSFTLPVLRLYNTDMDKVSKELAVRVGQAPDFFRNAPVVIDLHHLKSTEQSVDFPLLVGLLRGHGMIPVGVRNGSDEQLRIASALDLAVLADQRIPRPPRSEARPPPPAPKPQPRQEPPP
ncbi:MAG: septum site-determining protein MinC, partial [Chromatiales bacterium]|nr:septum site-determining protein MinC [Chromatiales bacterium]